MYVTVKGHKIIVEGHIFIDCKATEIMHLVASVRPSVRFVCALTAKPFDLRPSSFAWESTLTLAKLAM